MSLFLPCVLLAAAAWHHHTSDSPTASLWARPTAQVWPADLLEPLSEYAAGHPDGTPIFNEPILGGFLIYNFPTLRVFADGRCELYGEEFLRDLVAAWKNPEKIAAWQDEYGFRAAFIEADSPLAAWFQQTPGWRSTHPNEEVAFYVFHRERAGLD